MRLRYERSLTRSEVCTQFSAEELRNPFETNSQVVAEYTLVHVQISSTNRSNANSN